MKVDGMEIKEILEFPATPGFGKWRKYFPEDAIAHPAKMNLNLLEYLVLNYTNEGDTVLDPMAGTGSTGVICALNGRNCIHVELEERFFRWMEQARENVEKTPLLTRKGKIVNICGDARRLSELLKEHEEEVRCVLFSPPYGNAISKQGGPCGISEIGISCKTAREYSGDVKNIGNLPTGDVDNIIFSPPYSESQIWISEQLRKDLFKGRKIFAETNDPRPDSEGQIAKLPHGEIDNIIFSPPFAGTSGGKGEKSRKPINERYPGVFDRCIGGNKGALSNNPAQIDNLPVGDIDTVIFSPPFGQAQRGGGIAQKGYDGQYGRDERLHLRHDRPLSDRKDNISNLPFSSVDVVLTSPPYSESIQTRTDEENRLKRLEEKGFLDKKEWQRPHTIRTPGRRAMFSENAYSDNNKNIGNLKHGEIDTILTSPPYEGSLAKTHHSPRADQLAEEKRYKTTYTELHEKTPEDNIGNLRKKTYLSEMLKVYTECFKVLKPHGKMIIIIKDFVRNFKVVKLHEHTIKLCELAGFVLKEVLLFKLPQQSFWRILYKKKHGSKVKNLDLLDYEWVLVFEKP